MESLKLKNLVQTKENLINFLKTTYNQVNKQIAVIAVSGGLDSAVSLTLLTEALGEKVVFPFFLPYKNQNMIDAREIASWNKIPNENWREVQISKPVDQLAKELAIGSSSQVRLGNVMARIRMIVVFDLAKKLDALVCGTENKSEHHLGYFTRFGDGAADLEPIIGLYKTQVRQLAGYLKIPQKFLDKTPSADLWPGQTDEQELGFSYGDADEVMFQLIDQKKKISEIEGVDKEIAKRVVKQIENTRFKHQVPYAL